MIQNFKNKFLKFASGAFKKCGAECSSTWGQHLTTKLIMPKLIIQGIEGGLKVEGGG